MNRSEALERLVRFQYTLGIKAADSDVRIKDVAETPTFAGVRQPGQPFEITGYAQTEALDGDMEIMLTSGIEYKSYFLKNGGAMFVDHNYDIMSCVGNCRNLKMTPRGLIASSRLITNTDNAKRNQVEAIARAGVLAHSVGVVITKYRKPNDDELAVHPKARGVIAQCTLIEITYTALPKNAECRADVAGTSEKSLARTLILRKT